MDCQDRARDSIPINEKVDHKTQSRMQKEMEACVGQCVDKQIQCIPTLQKRLEQNITQVSSQQWWQRLDFVKLEWFLFYR